MTNIRKHALNYLEDNFKYFNLMNPFNVQGLYPSELSFLNALPFTIPNPILLENLPYLFSSISTWESLTYYHWEPLTYYQQITNSYSQWHKLVDNIRIDELILPLNSVEYITLEGPFVIKDIQLNQALTLTSTNYSLLITQEQQGNIKRTSNIISSALFYRAYICIQDAVVRSYMAVVKDILNGQPDNELYIKGYSIKYISDMLYINDQAYADIDLPIIAWLMYTLFN